MSTNRMTPIVHWIGLVLPLMAACTQAAEPRQGDVTLTIRHDSPQPAGWPIVVELTLTNTGPQPIGWWCGGPDVYPPAQHFNVQVRYGAEIDWHTVQTTNGQNIIGSGFTRQLKPGESMVVPLAIPVEKEEGISIRIEPGQWGETWRMDKPAEAYVQLLRDRRYADQRRAEVIEAAISQRPAFGRHLAEQYADTVVIDAMLKLVTVDNAPITAGAARVLARQKTLPQSAGHDFAVLVPRWLSLSPRPEWGGLQANVVEAALKTQSDAARKAVLDVLNHPTEPNARRIALDQLRSSPGDDDWLRTVKGEIIAVQQTSPDDAELAKQTKLAIEWLDSRLKDTNRPHDGK